MLFGDERLNDYVYGTQFSVESDHKPLQSIFKKTINAAPPRIERMLLRLQKYDFNLTFVPGTSIPVPDALSRAYLPAADSEEQKFDYQVHMVINSLPLSDQKLLELKEATRNDPTLQKLAEIIIDSWPLSKESLPPELFPYFPFRDEITSAEGLLFKGDRNIIPSSLRKDMETKLHCGHLGLEKCRTRARQVTFWPGINAEISGMVSKMQRMFRKSSLSKERTTDLP